MKGTIMAKTVKELSPVGMIGIGNMGLPMSINMMADGFSVVGTDIKKERCDMLSSAGGTVVNSISEVVAKCRYIIISLPSIAAYHDVCRELAEIAAPGTVVIDTCTVPISDKNEEYARLSAKGICFLDNTLSGTGEQAKHKDVVVFGSGDEETYNDIIPILDGFAKAQFYLGEFGNGMKMKLIANQLVTIHNVSTAEAMLFAKRMGMDQKQVIKVISGGAGGSRMLDVRGPVMADRSWANTQISHIVFGKDIKLIDQALAEAGCPSPLFEACKPIYTAAIALGHGEDDTASVYDALERMCTPGE